MMVACRWLVALLLYTWVQSAWCKHLEFALRRGFDPVRSRLLDEASGFTELGEIKREPDGVYWSDIKIGKPEQMFSVIVDTGSSTIAVPCKGCQCGNHHNFDLGMASSAEKLSSKYTQCYSEGSCNRGFYVSAQMCLGEHCDVEKEGVRHNFGCCEQFASAFQKQEADGIIGMSGASGTLIADLRNHHKLEKDMFSLCLSASVGVLGVGGYDSTRHMEPLQWIPMTISEFYRVNVRDVFLNGESLGDGVDSLGTPIVDSGTTFTYVPNTLHDKLRNAFKNFCSQSGEHCKGVSDPSSALAIDRRDSVGCFAPGKDVNTNDLTPWLESFPTLEFVYDSADDPSKKIRTCIPSSTYLFRSSGNAFCVGILRGNSRFIIGAITMAGFDIVFDHEHSRLGMARSICNSKNDNDPSYRTSSSSCCGTCATAQANHYNAQTGTRTPLPTRHPTTRSPTAKPTPEITHGTNTTSDNHFFIVRDAPGFPGKTVYIPNRKESWFAGARTFGPNDVVSISSSGVVCLTEDAAWKFHKDAILVLSGSGVEFSVGPFCEFGEIRINEGAVFETSGPDETDRGEEEAKDNLRQRRRSLWSLNDNNEPRPGAVLIRNMVKITTGDFIILSGTAVQFLEDGNITSSLKTSFEVRADGELYCDLHHRRSLYFEYGSMEFDAPSYLSCYLTIGPHAVLHMYPDEKNMLPVKSLGSIQIQGTFASIVNRVPFVSFSLLLNSTFIWDFHFDTKFRIELDNQFKTEFEEVPHKARIFTVAKGGVQDGPTKIELPSAFTCANVTVDPVTVVQFNMPSVDCLNKCIRDPTYQCTAEEVEGYPWPPELPDMPLETTFEDTNGTLADYYNQLVEGLGIKDPKAKKSALGGATGGVLAGLLVFLAIYPPEFLKRFCCCFTRRRSGFDSL